MALHSRLLLLADRFLEFVEKRTGYAAIVCDETGTIVRATLRPRIGSLHAGAQKILRDEADEAAVSADEAQANPLIKEGFSCPIIVDGRRVGTFGITGPLAITCPLARVASVILASWLKDMQQADDNTVYQAELLRNLHDAVIGLDAEHTIRSWNLAAERTFGWKTEEVIGRPIAEVLPSDYSGSSHEEFVRRLDREGRMNFDVRRRARGGDWVDVESTAVVLRDNDSNVTGYVSVNRDVTERKRIEEQFRQSQKMEAVGRLAGGVAHDFNNLLLVILALSESLADELQPDDPMRADLSEIRKASQRAAALTRQLLTFSRRDVAQPRVVNLSEIVANLDKMLNRLIGEDVELTISFRGSGSISADPGQIEQVLMNLAVNARDAMPWGGKLTIETSNVELGEDFAREHLGIRAGPHVMLAVSDTGVGMDQATLSRIFEPFFTTKEVGKGTGLGLATVYGIVVQSGGTISVTSDLGKGTAFRIYFPRMEEPAQATVESGGPAGSLRGTETILLVEDEEQVRHMVRGILRKSGYTVLDAQNAGEALLLCERHPGRIDLLFTDVVMPVMSGPALAQRLSSIHPELKVLCMSGYAGEAVVNHGIVGQRTAFLQKPFTSELLRRKVREVLCT